jgi:DNA-binding transcriptional MerR regulator
MRSTSGGTIQLLARFEAYRDFSLPAQVDNFLYPGSPCSFCNHDIVEGPSGPECFPDGMDSSERRHYDKGTVMSASENIPIQPAYEIPDKLYFRIGEVARLAGIKPYVLRFWETEFPGLGPKKSGTGHRLYRRKDVELVLEIKRLLYEKRYTIEGARKSMETRGKGEAARPVKGVKKEKVVQTDLFADQPSMFDTVREELKALAALLK